MMWFLLLLCVIHIEPVILQGNSDRLILKGGTTPCEGHIEIYHEGKWGFVGDTHWNRSTEEVVCKSAHCGTPVVCESTHCWTPEDTWYVSRPLESKVWLDNMKCNGGESQLWQCEHPGWNTAFYPQDVTRMVKCSNKVDISLDGFERAGAVRYTTGGGKYGYFCSENWEKSAADIVCKILGYGKSKDAEMKGWANWKAFKESTKMKTSCSDIEQLEHLWQCVTEEDKTCDSPAFVICEGYNRLQLRGNTSNVCHGQLEKEENGSWNPVTDLPENQTTFDVWCRQMFCGNKSKHTVDKNGDTQVTCADNVTVTLKNSKNKCYGEVHIKVNNNKDYPVCGSSWTKKEAEVVCRELSCGKMVSFGKSNGRVEGIMDNVACSGNESSVWHCKAKRDIKSLPLQCSSTVSVVCGDSLKVNLVDGPAKCAGRVEIQYEGKWQKVDSNGWTETNSERVCSQLQCGGFRESANDKFCQGSSNFLAKAVKCAKNSLHISECITSEGQQPGAERKAVGIICEDHKVVFLEGNKSCSGFVGIEHGSKTFWLSGSKQTWNRETADTVCQQTHCGRSKGNPTTREKMGDIWNETYSCSPDAESLFDCEKSRTQPVSEGVTSANNVTRSEELCKEHNNTSANTTTPSECEKKMTQPLSEGVAYVECTGNINVNLTKGCWGYVNICEREGCGGVCADAWTDEMSEMLCEDLKCGKTMKSNRPPNPQSKVIFKSVHIPKYATNLNQSHLVRNDEKSITCKQAYVVCSGSVELKLNSRSKCSGNVETIYEDQTLPVCKKALENSETKKVICKTLECGDFLEEVSYFGPEPASALVISNIECSRDSKSLDECTVASDRSGCELGGLRCSNWSKTELKFDKACSGAVFIYSEGKHSYVKNETDGEKYCEDLKCGQFKSYKNSTVRYSQEQLRFIECEGEPNVTLSEECGGEVKINDINVCSTEWNDRYSDLICMEQGCGKAITTIRKDKEDKKKKDYYHVTCEDYHHKLGQCSNFKAECKDNLVSVYCVSRVKFKTTDTCGGWININYQNKWEKLCPPEPFALNLQKELCKNLSCGEPNEKLRPKDYNSKKKDKSVMTLDCPGSDSRIKYCIKKKNSSCDERPAEIYCGGFVPYIPQIITPPQRPVLPIILGVGISLILVILIAVYVRFYIVRRAKKPINFPSRMVPNKEIEFESGEYDDVTRDEIEDYSPGRFRSEARVIAESDMRSPSPISYDDIDESAETRPLTSQGAPAGTLRDNFINEGAIRQSSDDVNYEVEDPPENYDDIDASPVVSQTKAEVHGSSQTTTEGIPAATPGSVPEDKGYLVPGQDG